MTGVILSTQGSAELTEIKVYPNPAKNTIQLDLGIDQNELISIYDASGRIVKLIQAYTSNQLIAIDELKNGFYFITDGNG